MPAGAARTMNYPAASCGVSEKTELLSMYSRITNPLPFDVPLNAFFITVLPYRAHKVPIAPKLSAPKLLFYFRALPKYFPRRYALDDLYNLLRTIHRYRLYQKMHMVLVRPDLTNVISHRLLISIQTSFRHRSTGVNTTRRYFAGHTTWYNSTDTLWLLRT